MTLTWKDGSKRIGCRAKVMDGDQEDGFYRILHRRDFWWPGRFFDYGVEYIRTDQDDRRHRIDWFAVGGADTLDEAKALAEKYEAATA
jgi:hypothetical protein